MKAKSKGLSNKGTKKELCKRLKIHYVKFYIYRRYLLFGSGAHSYPKLSTLTKSMLTVGMKSINIDISDENRVAGMIVFNIIEKLLNDSSKIDDDNNIIINFDKLDKLIPKPTIDLPKPGTYVSDIFNKISYILEKVTSDNIINDEDKKKVTELFLSIGECFAYYIYLYKKKKVPLVITNGISERWVTRAIKYIYPSIYESSKFLIDVERHEKNSDNGSCLLFNNNSSYLEGKSCRFIDDTLALKDIFFIDYFENKTKTNKKSNNKNSYKNIAKRIYIVKSQKEIDIIENLKKYTKYEELFNAVKKDNIKKVLNELHESNKKDEKYSIHLCLNNIATGIYINDKENLLKFILGVSFDASMENLKDSVKNTLEYIKFSKKENSSIKQFKKGLLNVYKKIKKDKISTPSKEKLPTKKILTPSEKSPSEKQFNPSKEKSPSKILSPLMSTKTNVILIKDYTEKSDVILCDFSKNHIKFKDDYLKKTKGIRYNSGLVIGPGWVIQKENIKNLKKESFKYGIFYKEMTRDMYKKEQDNMRKKFTPKKSAPKKLSTSQTIKLIKEQAKNHKNNSKKSPTEIQKRIAKINRK